MSLSVISTRLANKGATDRAESNRSSIEHLKRKIEREKLKIRTN